MSLHIEIPDDLAKTIVDRASASGVEPEQFALGVIRESLSTMKSLDETLAPVREAFKRSGMTEDELSELLEEEKHAMRRGE